MSHLMQLSFKLMGYGLSGVFITLILFIVMINVLTKVFPFKEDSEK